MNISNLIDQAIALAKAAAPMVPTLGAGAAIAEKIVGIIDDLTDDAPDTRTQQEMQEQRAILAEAVKAKARATSDRLRG
jgi:hypothetical protein